MHYQPSLKLYRSLSLVSLSRPNDAGQQPAILMLRPRAIEDDLCIAYEFDNFEHVVVSTQLFGSCIRCVDCRSHRVRSIARSSWSGSPSWC